MAEAKCLDEVSKAKPIEVFALMKKFREDPDSNKVNLSVGAYRTDDGQPWVLPIVHTVEQQMANDETLNHEYLPISGLPEFCKAATKLILGDNSPAILQNRAESLQCIGGTGAIRLGLEFLKKCLGKNDLYISDPTWPNHRGIATSLGYGNIKTYRYWDAEKRALNINGMIEDIENAPEGSVIVLHMCAHNPTGVDPSADDWNRIAEVVRRKKHFPFFDGAYQGFSSGNLETDAKTVRKFVEEGFEMFIAQSFSKNFGLYNERVGNLVYIVNKPETAEILKTQFELIVRQLWSNPPAHGARVVATVLNNSNYFSTWKEHVRTMAERILSMRDKLFNELRKLGTPGTWTHIIEQTGMFSYTGLNPEQCEQLVKDYHIYVMQSGRINMCGLTTKNMEYVAKAIDNVVRGLPKSHI